MYVFTRECIHKKVKMTSLKSCIFPLTIFFYKNFHLWAQEVRKESSGNENHRNTLATQHNTHHQGNSKFSRHLSFTLFSAYSTETFTQIPICWNKKCEPVWGKNAQFPYFAKFPTQTPVFPRGAMQGFPGITVGRVSVEHACRAASCACGLRAWAAQACPPTQPQKQNKLWKTDRSGVAATQWHKGKCCMKYGSLLNECSKELQGSVEIWVSKSSDGGHPFLMGMLLVLSTVEII